MTPTDPERTVASGVSLGQIAAISLAEYWLSSMETLEETQKRRPFFDGADTERATYSLRCDQCGTTIKVRFKQMLDAAWGWRDRTDPDLASRIAKQFRIDLKNTSIRGGMDAVVSCKCPNCGRKLYGYFWFPEYRHSCYEISMYGIAADASE